MFANLFRQRFSSHKRWNGQSRQRGAGLESLGIQLLESRVALAITTNPVQLTTSTPKTFAWVIAIDDTVDAQGNGRHLYMQSSTNGSPYFLIDDNPGFSSPTQLGRNFAGFGTCSTVLVISSGQNGTLLPVGLPGGSGADLPVAGLLPGQRQDTSGNFAHGFTFQASTTVPTERLIVDLSPAGSRISLDSQWNASLGDTDGATFGADKDWGLYQSYGGYLAAGQVALFATEINVSSNVTSSSRFGADTTLGRASGFTQPIRSVTVNAAIQATDNRFQVEGDSTATPTVPGQLIVSTGGSVSGSSTMSVNALGANVVFEGNVTAPQQTYLLNAMPGVASDPNAYVLSTRSRATGNQSGTVSSAGSIGITMGNPSGGTVDLRTAGRRIAFQTGTSGGVPYRYDVSIEDTNDLQIDSVGSSSGDIAIRTGGNLTVLGDAIRTTGGLTFAATGTLSLTGSVGTANGDVQLVSNTLALTSDIMAGGGKSVTLRSSSGGTTTNALVKAGGSTKKPVRVASTRPEAGYDQPTGKFLGLGALSIDGVPLNDRDRVLLKNQTDPKENGIYVFKAETVPGANDGELTRDTDADSSAKMQPGFVAFVLAGTQSGAWVFRNATAPQFNGTVNQTPLSFVPATAARVFDDVRTATSGPNSLTGTPTINGVPLNAGDRVLVKDQLNWAENGIYVVATGLGGAWVRAADADAASEMRAGSHVFIREGTLGGQGWALAKDAVQVGTTPLNFTPFTQPPILQTATVATTVNLASLSGLQTIDGVALVAGKTVLVKNQIDATKNGLYTVASGTWGPPTPPPRGASLYVESGATNGGTAWQFNDSSSRIATIALNSPSVTGLVTTAGLSVGMLVTGTGIPSGTTITSIGTDGTSLQLSSNATLSATNSPLTFTSTGAVSTATPIVFVPAGGTVTLTSAGSIAGSSSLQGATAVLTAGTAGVVTSSIATQTKVGRLNASAPGAITLTSGIGIELEQVRTTSAGAVSVTTDGTLTALNVAAAGTASVAGNVGLTSLFGDVITEVVTSSRGDIALSSINNDVAVTRARTQPANVSAARGNVSITANSPTTAPTVRIDGRVSAQGTGGIGDVAITSSRGQAVLTGNAVVLAADTLEIDTPQAGVGFSGTPQIAATALDLTAQFGAPSYDPRLGTYQIVTLNRTDAGNIFASSAASLTVRGATTFAGGITFQAPDITVTGPIQPSGASFDIVLNATAGDLRIDTPLTSPHDIRLSATGRISASGGATTPLLKAAGTLVIRADSSAKVQTDVATLDAVLTGTGAVLEVTEADSLWIDRISTPAGGTATIAAGNPSDGGSVTVRTITMGPSGSVKITAAENILEDSDASADIVANRAELIATTGRIDLDTDVNILLASALQRNQTVTIDDVGTTPATQLQLQSVATTNANIAVTALRPIVAASVVTAGAINLTTMGAASDILVGDVRASGSTISLNAGGSIREASSSDATADVTATTVSLVAAAGSIDVHLDAAAVAATATALGSTITIRDDNALGIGDASTGINGKAVSLVVGGQLTQTMPIVATSLTITASAGDVLLSNAANDIGSLTVSNLGRGVTFRDANGFDIGTAGITGGAVDLTVGGPLTQTGAVRASSLVITSTAGGPITFNNSANNVDTIEVSNVGNDITFTDVDGVAVGNFVGRDIRLNVGGAITQAATAGITATGLLTINFTGAKQPIALNGLNDLTSFSIDSGSQPVALNDINSLAIGAITAGAVTLTVGGNLTQTNAIVAQSLTASSTGGVIILNASNDVGSLSVTNPGRAVEFRDVNALGIAGLTGGAVQLTVGGGLTQSGAIAATALRVDASAGDIALTNAGNAIGSIAGSNPGRAFSVANTGNLAQAAGIVAGTLSVSNTGGSVLLNAANDVDNLAINNGAGAVGFTDVDGVSIIGLTGGAVTLAVGGPLTQTGRIAASSLQAFASGGSISLTREDNAVSGAFTATAPGGNVSFTNASGLIAGRVEAGTAGSFNGNVALKAAGGSIQLTDDVIALDDTVKLEARNGTISQTAGKSIASAALVWFAQVAPALNTTATAVGRNLTAPGTPLPPIVDNSFGTVTVYDSSATSGNIVVNAPNASEVVIAGALVPGAGGRVDLRGVNPNAVLKVRGDGDLQGVQVLVPRSTTTFTWIVSGPTAADAGTALANAITHANSVMPKLATQTGTRIVPVKPIRPSTIDASTAPVIDVQQSLPALNVPVTFVTPTTIRAVGGAVSGSGLRLGPGASGSQIANLAFQGFDGTGIELDRVQRARVQGVSVTGGSAGLSVAGASNGTIVVGNTFRNVQTGLVLSSASRLTFGGRRAGEANRIENATREAVFATGFATGTQLIKTQYVGGSSAIVTRNVRGLKVVK